RPLRTDDRRPGLRVRPLAPQLPPGAAPVAPARAPPRRQEGPARHGCGAREAPLRRPSPGTLRVRPGLRPLQPGGPGRPRGRRAGRHGLTSPGELALGSGRPLPRRAMDPARLTRIPLFADLPSEELARIATFAEEHSEPEG